MRPYGKDKKPMIHPKKQRPRPPRDKRTVRPRRPEARVERRPMPIGEKCNPLCPLFYCSQKVLYVTMKIEGGQRRKVALCRMTGSECIGIECKYASCRINALLPDGKCAKAIEKVKRPMSDEELFKEIEAIEDYDIESFK